MTDTMFEQEPVEDVTWRGANELRRFLVPVGDLVAFPDNPPRDERHVHFIAKSLRDFGQVRAILTWENAAEFDLPPNTIVGGHHVWLASQEDDLKWSHVAAIPAHFTSYSSASTFLALDNLASQRTMKEQAEQRAFIDIPEYRDALGDLRDPSELYLEDVAELKISEQSVRRSPDEIIEHMAASLKEFGFMGQVTIARDGTILAGEDVMRAAALAGIHEVPVRRVDLDPNDPEALKIMALDYTAGKRAMVDDRAFAELLKNIQDDLGELEGTGYDADMLSGLLLMTRSAAEIRDESEAYEWMGLSEYAPVRLPVKHIISFDDEEARDKFFEKANQAGLGLGTIKHTLATSSGWWPHRERQDPASLRWEGEDRPPGKGDHLPAHDEGRVHADAKLLG